MLNMTKKFWIILIFVIIIGVTMDIGVVVTGEYLIQVNENYIYYVYSVICTTAILSYSILSLLMGILDKKYYGFKLKDILLHIQAGINLKSYIISSLFTIFLSTIVMAVESKFNSVNTLTMILICLLIIEGVVTIWIYKLVTDDSCLYIIVSEHVNKISFDNNENEYKYMFECLCNGMDEAIKSNDCATTEKIFDMFGVLVKNNSKLSVETFIEFNSRAVSISNKWGYGVYLNNIIKITTDEDGENINELIEIPLREVQLFDENQILKENYLSSITEICLHDAYKDKKISDNNISNMLITYFNSIIKNRRIDEVTKKNKIADYFNKLCMWSWWRSDAEIKPNERALLYIFKKYIFSVADGYDRNELMELLLLSMLKEMYYREDDYYLFLSQISEAFYFYVYREKELLTDKARSDIGKLFKITPETQDRENARLPWYVSEGAQKILRAIGKKIINRHNQNYQMFEYFPRYMKVKTVVWTEEADVEFAFIFYIIFIEEFLSINFWDACFSEQEIEDNKKLMIVNTIMKYFDNNSKHFSENGKKQLTEAKILFERTYDISERMQESLFDYFNKLKKKLNDLNLKYDVEKTNVIVEQEKLDELLKKDKIYGVCQDEEMDSYLKFSINPYICSNKATSFTTHTLFNMSVAAINDCIKVIADKLVVSFDDSGIEKMSGYLESHNFDTRNYTFTNDWAMNKYSEQGNYKLLKQKIEEMNLIKTPNLKHHLYFLKDNYKVRIKLTEIERLELKLEDCEEYISEYRTSNGMYNIEGALYTREEAIQYVKKGYYKEKMSFKICYTFSKNDITNIVFQRNNYLID